MTDLDGFPLWLLVAACFAVPMLFVVMGLGGMQ